MRCKHCGGETFVIAATTENDWTVQRTRRCGACQKDMTSWEVLVLNRQTNDKAVRAAEERIKLHRRNQRILALIRQGRPYRLIAQEFDLSIHAIDQIKAKNR